MSMSINKTRFTSEEISEAFTRLEVWLKERGLTTAKYYDYSLGTTHDFMLMYEGYSGEGDEVILAFKHSDSRNYLYINKNPRAFNK